VIDHEGIGGHVLIRIIDSHKIPDFVGQESWTSIFADGQVAYSLKLKELQESRAPMLRSYLSLTYHVTKMKPSCGLFQRVEEAVASLVRS
jgi:hypothetical protein